MDAAGRQAADTNCMWLLTDRLKFFNDFKLYPLADEVIDHPMFATGEPRSGTTLMHALMSVDPDARALRFWEVMHPSPPPGVAGDSHPGIALAEGEWQEINTKMWKWLHCHPYNDMDGDGLPEDERTWAFDFRVMTPTAWWRVPMQNLSMGLPTDSAAQNRIHKMMLQSFQYRRPKKYWVLKGFHGFRLKEFFDTYPDATLVWLHRDPVQVAASSTAMMRDIMEGIVGKIDLVAEAKMHVERVRMSHRQHHGQPAGRRSAHPSRALQGFRRRPDRHDPGLLRVYRAGTDPAGRSGDARLPRRNKGDRHGKFEYSTSLLTDAGYAIDELNEEFRPFRERFDVPSGGARVRLHQAKPLLFRGGVGVVAQRELRSRSDYASLAPPPAPSSEEEGD